jgi:hypothetical protein
MPRIFEAPPGFVLNPDYLVPELEAQRDLLLEALKLARLRLIAHGDNHAKIDAAIKAAEGD